MEIAGKVAIVTGAGAGIGAALAHRLVAGGARVVVADLDPDTAAKVAGELGDSAVAVGGDVGAEQVVAALIEAAESAFGPVDLYFANAGIGGGPGLDSTEDQWAAAIDVNVMAHVRAAKLLVPGWVERGGGYFVSTASAAGLLTQIGSAPYSVTKHAAVGFAEWLAVTYGDKGVRVSCLCPMGVDTRLLSGDLIPGSPEAAALAIKAVTTAGAVLSPEEVADTVVEAMAAEHFLILPHQEVLQMYRNKGADYDRWLAGMRRFQAMLRG
ncbi:SDR family oxidoreductase [Nocardia sp. NPDC055053]